MIKHYCDICGAEMPVGRPASIAMYGKDYDPRYQGGESFKYEEVCDNCFGRIKRYIDSLEEGI